MTSFVIAEKWNMNYSGYFTDKNGNKYYPESSCKFWGLRRKYYLIGTWTTTPTYQQLTMFVSNLDYYDSAIPGFINIDRTNKIVISPIVPWNLSSYKKNIYIYKSGNYNYIFLRSPDYNDDWYIEIIRHNRLRNLLWREFTEAEFQEYVKDMTLVSSA